MKLIKYNLSRNAHVYPLDDSNFPFAVVYGSKIKIINYNFAEMVSIYTTRPLFITPKGDAIIRRKGDLYYLNIFDYNVPGAFRFGYYRTPIGNINYFEEDTLYSYFSFCNKSLRTSENFLDEYSYFVHPYTGNNINLSEIKDLANLKILPADHFLVHGRETIVYYWDGNSILEKRRFSPEESVSSIVYDIIEDCFYYISNNKVMKEDGSIIMELDTEATLFISNGVIMVAVK